MLPEGDAVTVTVGVSAPVTGGVVLPPEEVPLPQPVMRDKPRDTVPSRKAQRPIFVRRLFMAFR
jgi:hypothetical protein